MGILLWLADALVFSLVVFISILKLPYNIFLGVRQGLSQHRSEQAPVELNELLEIGAIMASGVANKGKMKILTKNNIKIIIGVTQLKINIYKA
jgi:hypothetical protein